MIAKLRNVLTRRVLKMLEDESKKDIQKYNKWFNEFSVFLKEGLSMDSENAEQILRLIRFYSNFSGNESVSLEDYIAKTKKDQEKIYFIVSPSVE